MQMCAALPAKKLESLVAHLLLWQVGVIQGGVIQVGVIEVRGPAVSRLALLPQGQGKSFGNRIVPGYRHRFTCSGLRSTHCGSVCLGRVLAV